MLPFFCEILPGRPAYEQVVAAVHRALATGTLKEGDSFPSVRSLSQEMRINPNTALKIVQQLTAEGILEVSPGIGTRIAKPRVVEKAHRRSLLQKEMEEMVIHAKRLGVSKTELLEAMEETGRDLELGTND